ncbi:MAG: beta-propeller domain-containing protein [Methanobacteriota archaeon]
MKTIMRTCGLLLVVLILSISSPVVSIQQDNSLVMGQITSDGELNRYLANQTNQYYGAHSSNDIGDYVTKDLITGEAPMPVPGEMKAASPVRQESPLSNLVSGEKEGASTYTTTNIQVAGVDEADFVKNDGKYIYIVSGNSLSIVQAYPPQAAAIISQTNLPGSVNDIFLTGDRLVVFTGRYDYAENLKQSQYFGSNFGIRTSAMVYDISDRANPKKIREISAPGTFESARMIGTYVYFLTQQNQGYSDPRMPVIFDDTREIKVGSVWYPPGIVNEIRMNTVTSFPVMGSGTPEAISFLLGWDTTLYVSPTDVFVSYQKDQYGWNRPLVANIGIVQNEVPLYEQQSVVHRFAINQGSINYKATGTVPGYLLNQFSLDQYDGNLRVATTVEDWTSSKGQYSNVYVMNPDLKVIGKVEQLAPGEKIYSARFLGDILYLVTFKQTDPLFVIDLSNPAQPGVLGELKIPGYSDYLHPYDKTHLIGIGKDTYENSGGGVIPTGVKLAFFDVSDLNNPRLIDRRVIGEKGSDSAVLTDHRAFLFDKEKSVLVLPIKEVINIPVFGSRYEGSYTEEVWQGAYVFGIDSAEGFTEIGRVHHNSGSSDESWWAGSTVRRSIFMDSILYTISQNTILGSDLKDLSKRLMQIDFSHTPEDPWYMRPLWSTLIE